MKHHIVCLGNAVIDMSFGGTQFPIVANEHQLFRFTPHYAGGMANTAICAARLGLEVTSLGNIGDDNLADLWRAPLLAEGIAVEDMMALAWSTDDAFDGVIGAIGRPCFCGSSG